MSESKLLNGIILFKPNDKAPDFVLASGVITPSELNEFIAQNQDLLTEYNGKKQLRIQVLKSKDGKPYMKVDTYKAEQPAGELGPPPELPDTGSLPF